MTTNLPASMKAIAADMRRTMPTAADQRRNPDIDVMHVWRDDIEHTITAKGWDAEQAEAFRALCGAD